MPVPYRLAGNIVPHVTGYDLADHNAPKGDYYHSGQHRIGVYAQDWNTVGPEWQDMHYEPVTGRVLVRPAADKTQQVLLTRRYLLEMQQRIPMAPEAYQFSQSQLMRGNVGSSQP